MSLNTKTQQFIKRIVLRIKDIEMSNISAIVSYYMLLSLFPLLVTAGTLIPFFHIDYAAVQPYLTDFIPQPVMALVEPVLFSLLTTQNGGLLSLSILATIWSASKGMRYIQAGLDKAYCLEKKKHFLHSRVISLVTLIVIIVLLVITTLAFSFGETLLQTMAARSAWALQLRNLFHTFKWPVTLLMLLLTLMIIFKSTPNIKLRLRQVFPGALFSSVALLLLVQGISIYLDLASRSVSAYGTLSALFILLLWLRLAVYVILLGAVVNAVVEEIRQDRPQQRCAQDAECQDEAPPQEQPEQR